MLADNLNQELRTLGNETFEVVDLADLGMDAADATTLEAELAAAACSSSCSCSSCCSCSTSSCCSCSTSTSSCG